MSSVNYNFNVYLLTSHVIYKLEAVSVMVSKVHGAYHAGILLNNIDESLVKTGIKPVFGSVLFECTRWNMAHDDNLLDLQNTINFLLQ